jgi:hypothetical protein
LLAGIPEKREHSCAGFGHSLECLSDELLFNTYLERNSGARRSYCGTMSFAATQLIYPMQLLMFEWSAKNSSVFYQDRSFFANRLSNTTGSFLQPRKAGASKSSRRDQMFDYFQPKRDITVFICSIQEFASLCGDGASQGITAPLHCQAFASIHLKNPE